MTHSQRRPKPVVQIVDDDRTLRMLMRAALEKAGFDVRESEDGLVALDDFPRFRPDLLLMDVVMPGMDGFATCQALRSRTGGEHVPVLMVTGLDDIPSIHKAFEVGATDFITKPLNWTMLGYRVRYMLRSGQTLKELQKSREQLAKAQDIARLGHWELNAQSHKFHFSKEVCRLLGLHHSKAEASLEEILGMVHSEDQQGVRRLLSLGMSQAKPFSIRYRAILANGEEHVFLQQGEAIHDEDGQPAGMVGTLQDVTEHQKAEEAIRRLAFFDTLTGLANRLLFRDRVDQALGAARRSKRNLALMFLDLDRFKRINDTFGHHIGDQLLQKVAERLNTCIRTSDSISLTRGDNPSPCVSRLGDDEFSILLSNLQSPQDAAKVAQRITEAVSRPVFLDGQEMFVTASLGISIFPNDGEDADTLLKNADTAMHHAKEEGRNNYLFYQPDMNAMALERLTLENDLRRALERNEFELHFQPQVDFAQKRIFGVEALIRWRHPERGLLSPESFIPLAEETGLIIPINEWVLRKACQQARQWQNAGLDHIQISVNQSGHQSTLQDIVKVTKQALKDSGLPATSLTVEFTESLLMQKEEDNIGTLERLRALGVRIAIDDFGTGYSSLSYLKAFPITTLKIDRSFVRDITSQNNDAAITRAIVAMANSLNLNIIVEGVETEEQLAFLVGLGCYKMQGFHFSRPIPEEQLLIWLRAGGLVKPQ